MVQVKTEKLSPMMQQYWAVKDKHKDHIVFYRLGDFYEMFFDDALLASRELELTLTGRDCGLEERAPMCGVPHHACEAYVARLIKKGYKVAICEQMEDPAQAKGVVRRDVVRVVTPGTLIESNLLDEDSNNFIACVLLLETGWALCCADSSTGQLAALEFDVGDLNGLLGALGRYSPSEIIFNDAILDKKPVTRFIKDKLQCVADLCDNARITYEAAQQQVESHFHKSLGELGLTDRPGSVCAVGGMLAYLYETQIRGLERISAVTLEQNEQYMKLDITARRNLELCASMRTGEKKGTLLWVLDKTRTAMGKRLLRNFVEQPLVNPAMIVKRLNAVEQLFEDTMLRCDVVEQLGGIFDLERMMTRIIYGAASPREMKALGQTCARMPALKGLLAGQGCAQMAEIYTEIDSLEDLSGLLEHALVDDPPAALKDGGVIRAGYSAELDELRMLVQDTQKLLLEIEAGERARTGIKNLKVGYNRVFGYYLEVTKSNIGSVPDGYIRKQTLANCERYITQDLKELEGKILSAGERISSLEESLFEQVRAKVASELHRVQSTASAIAKLDVFAALASVAVANGYCRPEVNMSEEVRICDGRHPVVEQLMNGSLFVANDTVLNCSDQMIAVITGPNMAGKSTYMRQTALIVLMAQMGSFVPAASATIGMVDGIYTRVGASDDLASGQSTFMVEMSEVAQIMKSATSRSLLILDEIGRGTSTFDGMSIARAVIEYIADKHQIGAKTLFATHYHELTVLEQQIAGVRNYNIACKKRGDELTFLRRILPGGADDSYGIEVSKLAGVPEKIIRRARQVLELLEQSKEVDAPKGSKPPSAYSGQMTLAAVTVSPLEEALRRVDVNTLTPIEALNKLYELKALLKQQE